PTRSSHKRRHSRWTTRAAARSYRVPVRSVADRRPTLRGKRNSRLRTDGTESGPAAAQASVVIAGWLRTTRRKGDRQWLSISLESTTPDAPHYPVPTARPGRLEAMRAKGAERRSARQSGLELEATGSALAHRHTRREEQPDKTPG